MKQVFRNALYSLYTQYKKLSLFINRKPLFSFFIGLLFLLLVIIVGNLLTQPQQQKTPAPSPKVVTTYNVGQTPKASYEAKIAKAGVVKIVALTSGVVQAIFRNEGDTVGRGGQLFLISTNYQGGNASAIQAQIADAQYKNVLDTFDKQNDAIQKQRDIANATHDNFSDMQSIATQSANQTNALINTNQTVLDQLNSQLIADQSSAAPQATILQEEEQINQLQGAQNQLKQTLLNLQEQTDSGKAPGRLADAQQNLTLDQLDVQEKTLELNKEVSKLQADVADITAAAMYPASPFAGIVQRIYVHIGQQISPGTPLAEVSSTNQHATAIVSVPKDIAQKISKLDASTLFIDNNSYSLRPTFVSTEATDGSLYVLTYSLPDNSIPSVTDGEYIKVDVPIGATDTSSAVPFIPIDAIYQTQNTNYVLVVVDKKATAREVSLGNVFGSYVEINHGLHAGDQVILERNVVTGDSVITN
ncbi:MAG TPA: HlyD family efflux transporter periplasmic adaptor subunit [Patescibacteria group bacterium]|nr:HlyD family efflux transporter periplasmic adaptor subunit [Patescibacteria group bacterium]